MDCRQNGRKVLTESGNEEKVGDARARRNARVDVRIRCRVMCYDVLATNSKLDSRGGQQVTSGSWRVHVRVRSAGNKEVEESGLDERTLLGTQRSVGSGDLRRGGQQAVMHGRPRE